MEKNINHKRYKNRFKSDLDANTAKTFQECAEKRREITKKITAFRKISGTVITNEEILEFYNLVLQKNKLSILLGKRANISSIKTLESKMFARGIKYVKNA